MSSNNYKPTVVSPDAEGLDLAVEETRNVLLNELPWLTKAYHIAQRFVDKTGGKTRIVPRVYAPINAGSRDYQTLTPDDLAKGMMFFYASDGKLSRNQNESGFTHYNVGLIFGVNLDKIDKERTDLGLYTQNLIHATHKVLKKYHRALSSSYEVIGESRDLKTVYREFSLDEVEDYNTAPLQSFRLDLQYKIEIPCI
jgi:hypothetical protein